VVSTATLLTPTVTVPVLTRDERQLIAAIHAWARQRPAGAYFPRWEPGYYPSWWKSSTAGGKSELLVEVSWGYAFRDKLHVEIRRGQHGERLLDETVSPRSVREAVDLLVVWGILPRTFLSLHMAGGAS
jgi:hypothetical protein